jgi:Protein of unknown function (DUF3606)
MLEHAEGAGRTEQGYPVGLMASLRESAVHRKHGAKGEAEMGSANPPKKRDYGDKTRIDMNQSYQVAYWKERFGVSEEKLSEAVRATGAFAKKVEAYLRSKDVR